MILRGINAGGDSKLPPFEPFSSEASADQIASMGMNAVRYCAVWEAIEPEKGRYDERHLDRMEEIVGWLTRRGIYVFLDMHQDLWSRAFAGSGAPAWTTPAVDRQQLVRPDGGPEWFFNYTSDPVCDAFERFWHDGELQAHFCEAVRRVAKRFAGNDMVIGYEIWNEPWQGRRNVHSGEFEQQYLAPFYEKVIAAIREHDPRAIVFLEPALLAAGLFTTQSHLPRFTAPNLVYAPHYYPTGALLGTVSDIEAALKDFDQNLVLVGEKADQLGATPLLGEFGFHPRQPDGERFLRGFYDALDRHLMSATVWTYALRDLEWNQEGMSLVDADLTERPHVNAVDRPYPKACSGTPIAFSFNAETCLFRLDLDGQPAKGPTLIHVPRRGYGDGMTVRASGGTFALDDPRRELIWEAGGESGRRFIEIAPRHDGRL